MKTKQPMTVLERTFIGLALLALTAGIALIQFTNVRDRDPVVRIPLSPPPPQPNAYDYVASAAGMCVDTSLVDDVDLLGPPSRRPDLRKPAVMAAVLAILKVNRPAIDLLQTGFRYHYLAPQAPSGGYPTTARFRAFGRVLACDAEVAAFRGNHAELIDRSLDAVQMGEMLPFGGRPIYLPTGTTCAEVGRNALWRNYQMLNAAECREAIKRLNAIEKMHVPIADVVRAGKWAELSALDASFRGPDWKDKMISNHPDVEISLRERLVIWSLSKQTVFDHLTAKLDSQITAAALPYGSQPRPTPSDPLVATWGGNSQLWRFFDADSEAHNRLLIVTLALRAYKLDHGRYPAALPQLVPSYIPTVPIDPFTAGAPLCYRVDGDRYVLYSVGADMHDDGGRPIDYKAFRSFDGEEEENAHGDIVAGVTGW